MFLILCIFEALSQDNFTESVKCSFSPGIPIKPSSMYTLKHASMYELLGNCVNRKVQHTLSDSGLATALPTMATCLILISNVGPKRDRAGRNGKKAALA